jgi:hypothetical protein
MTQTTFIRVYYPVKRADESDESIRARRAAAVLFRRRIWNSLFDLEGLLSRGNVKFAVKLQWDRFVW